MWRIISRHQQLAQHPSTSCKSSAFKVNVYTNDGKPWSSACADMTLCLPFFLLTPYFALNLIFLTRLGNMKLLFLLAATTQTAVCTTVSNNNKCNSSYATSDQRFPQWPTRYYQKAYKRGTRPKQLSTPSPSSVNFRGLMTQNREVWFSDCG